MTHFHLKHFPKTGSGKTNYGAVFYSLIDALSAAGLANATRGTQPGYYGVEECRIRACERPQKGIVALPSKRRAAGPKGKVRPRPGMLH